MDSGGGNKDGDSDTSGLSSLHDHSDLLIPNPSFVSSPGSVSSTASSSMMMTSPASEEHDLFKQMDCQMTSPGDLQQSDGYHVSIPSQPHHQPDSSPPNVVVDDSPLQPCMDRNKQSLKVRLSMRPPMNQLVDQGILPPPKTPAAFAGQRVRLERARMSDLLKVKIQQRPARQELIRQHILEDTDCRVAPSLAEKQRMLKRARLADSLSDHLIHRPGPLELVQKNILHAPDENIDKAIKDGIVSFKATCEGHVPGPSLPNKYTCDEDDSSSDISSPAGTPDASSSGHTTEANTPLSKEQSDAVLTPATPAPTPVSVPVKDQCEVTLQPAKTNKSESTPPPPPPPPQPPQLILAAASLAQKITPATLFQVTTAPATVVPPPPPLPPSQTIVLSDGAVRELLPQLQSAGFQLAAAVQKPQSSSVTSTLGKSRSSKKSSKSKSQPKARTIKFHEYKGPSSCSQKGSAGGASASIVPQSAEESSYELLLKQQQLFLQWQLEWQHKYPQILLPAAPKVPTSGASTSTISIGNSKTMSSFPVTTINLLNQQLTSSQSNASSTNVNSKPVPTTVTLAPKIEIAPKPESASSPAASKSSDTAPSSPEKSTSTFRSISLNNISDWKVNDLKAELKKRGLTVSGSKMQLVERLKAATAKDGEKKGSSVKMDVGQDESSSEAMEEESSGKSTSAPTTPAVAPPPTMLIGQPSGMENNNISILDLNGVPVPMSLQNILSLLGVSTLSTSDGGTVLVNNNNNSDNNVKNAVDTINLSQAAAASTAASVITQLPISTVVATARKAAQAVNSVPSGGGEMVDENKILEQQRQIVELQKQLEQSQQELQKLSQQKDLNQHGGAQKHHRLVLQQHIQQKQRQQAIQEHLQNLIQLQNQKQAEQKKQQEQILQHQLIKQQQRQAQPPVGDKNVTTVAVDNNPVSLNLATSQPATPENHGTMETQATQWDPKISIPTQQERRETESLNFDDLLKNAETKEVPRAEVDRVSATIAAVKRSVKSQMVDDVLEILIRNGELPPSAAQDPHQKTPTPPSTGQENTMNGSGHAPPPPPPLPPPSFSVMLPTSIPFSRHNPPSTGDFLTFPGFGGRTEENLSKDAQEILRISEDLSNFGRSQEAAAAGVSKAGSSNHAGPQTSSMDCGFFTENKDFDLSLGGTSTADSMDVGFADSHSLPLRQTTKPFQASSQYDSGFSFGQPHTQSIKGDNDQTFISDEDLFPVPGHLDMQMDTDYSDWLDTLLPESNGNTSVPQTSPTAPSNTVFHHQDSDPQKNSTKTLFNNNITTNGSLFSSLLSSHPAQDSDPHSISRDPLLSSAREFFSTQPPTNFIFAQPQNHNSIHPVFFPAPVSLASSTATLMDTDFDELTVAACNNLTKKSENLICASSNLITDMPSNSVSHQAPNPPPITTSSINDNYLWDFPM